MSNAEQRDFWDAQSSWVQFQQAMDTTLQPVLDLVVNTAALKAGETVLDVGCGTGASVAQIAAQVGTEGHVTGVDISTTLISMARSRLEGVPQAELLLADAAETDLSRRYDAVLSRFGVMFFSDTTVAFSNIAQAVKPGGRFVLGTWAWARENPFFMMPAKIVRAQLGEMPPTDRTQPGPFAFENSARIIPMLTEAGLTDVVCTEVALELTVPGTPDDAAQIFVEIGPAKGGMAHFEATDEQRDTVFRSIVSELKKLATPEGIRMPALINLYTARLPD
ncbi:MAG: methyltransferase domain-containing protein [Rhodobacteraceae bacterium]|nr:methyltransferase domain-containing protein [Paracoccaceae bacterium]